ncbi:MAG: thioesterase family protein [Bacteroidota bacterium]
MAAFKQKTQVQIRFKDIDMMGHVNNANYITYFELARLTYFEALKEEGVRIDWVNEGVILAKIEMEYKQPILLEDKVFVYTWVSRMGSKSFDMACSIVRVINGVEVEAAKGLAVIVCFNYKANQTIAIPEIWKAKMVSE